VLGIHGVGRGGADYYLSDLGRELPVEGGARWAGRGLGLSGPISPEGLRRLLEGRHPVTDRPIGSSRVKVAAFDLTFSAPKSASVLFALGGTDAARTVVSAHEAAVAGALAYLEQHGVTAVRRDGPERVVIPTTGMVAGQFTHAVSRSGDPHLHSHVVMANLVHGADGRWSACDRRGLDAHRQAASSLYEAHLRAGLVETMGVCWTAPPLGRSAEIAGVPPELLGAFSSRGADIRRRVHETGARSAWGRRVAWAATRPAKTRGLDHADAALEWRRRAHEAGGSIELDVRRDRPGVLDEHRVAATLSVTPHGGAHRRDVVAAFAGGARDGVVADSADRLVAFWVPSEGVGVAEPLRQRRDALPRAHHLRALGPRPVDPVEHEVWVGAAQTIEAYRERWGVQRSAAEPLGVGRDALAALPTARLADHLTTLRQIDVARVRLGRRDPVAVELDRGLGLGR
jgi:conjugative relaxase-like TrwC/TraI family protein